MRVKREEGEDMRKYWNALRYGNAKTKRILVSVILLFLLFIAGIVLAVSGSGVTWGLIAVFAVIMDIVLLQSVRFGDVQMLAAKSKKEAVNAVKEGVCGSFADFGTGFKGFAGCLPCECFPCPGDD